MNNEQPLRASAKGPFWSGGRLTTFALPWSASGNANALSAHLILVMLVLSLSLEELVAQESRPRVPITEIESVWNARQQRVRTLVVEWETKRWFVVGSKAGNEFSPQHGESTEVFPAKDETVHILERLTLKDEKWRYDATGSDWHGRAEQVVPRTTAYAFNGTGFTHFADATGENVDRVHPEGWVFKDSRFADDRARFPQYAGIMMHFRPLHERYGHFRHSKWRVVGDAMLLGHEEIPSRSLEFRSGQSVQRIKVSATEPYTILHWNSHDRIFMDVEYTKGESSQCMPLHWRGTLLAPDRKSIQETWSGKVTKCVENGDVPDEVFEVAFPANTAVVDESNITREHYIVRNGGARRVVTDAELAREATYSELLRTESGQAMGRHGPASRRHWVLWLVSVTLAVAVSIYCINRYYTCRSLRSS